MSFINPATLSGLGSLAAGIGGIAGGFGLGQSKGASLGKQLEYSLGYDYNRTKYIVQGAKAAGVHPMYALGTGGSFSPTISSGGGKDPAQIGAGIERAAKGLAGKPNEAYNSTMRDLGLKQAENEVRSSGYRADLLAIEAAKAAQGAASNNEAVITAARPTPKQEAIPLYVKVRDRSGKVHWWPNPELNMELPETFGLGMGLKGWTSDPTKSGVNTGPRPSSGRPRHYNYRGK